MIISNVPLWKKAPFVRLLVSVIAGILLQWHIQLPLQTISAVGCASLIASCCFFLLPVFERFRLGYLYGIATCMLFISSGALLTWYKDIRHDPRWIGLYSADNPLIIATLDESPIEKKRSYKATSTVKYIQKEQQLIAVNGRIIIYFKKQSDIITGQDNAKPLEHGSIITFKKPLQEIKNSGNPGSFDFKQHAFFKGITNQVYLEPGEYCIAAAPKIRWLDRLLENCREWVLGNLRKNIEPERELGLAQALLIGYKDDLDQTLLQSYANTGVVHVIAISGLHLGLIYWLLIQLFKPLSQKKLTKWIPAILIIAGLWLFSLLAGAQPSVLRSALMFTCIVLGENLSRKTSVINSLALSAFVLLCFNPYWLWDLGFQLSYSALLSIIIFYRPFYNWFYFGNKLLDIAWKMSAVTLASQVLTLPLCVYHFHQFPNYFLLANFVAVPLSSIILVGEIILCCISFCSPLALGTGRLLSWLISVLNTYIEKLENLPFSVWGHLHINIFQAILLVLFFLAINQWFIEKSASYLKWGLLIMLAFVSLRSYSIYLSARQQKILVYNVPRKRAIDMVDGRHYYFIGDSSLDPPGPERNFYLEPGRTLYRTSRSATLNGLSIDGDKIIFNEKRILLTAATISYLPAGVKQTIDLLLVSENSGLYIKNLAAAFDIRQVVFDATNPEWKINNWKKECDTLGIPYHDVKEKGAFVMNLH